MWLLVYWNDIQKHSWNKMHNQDTQKNLDSAVLRNACRRSQFISRFRNGLPDLNTDMSQITDKLKSEECVLKKYWSRPLACTWPCTNKCLMVIFLIKKKNPTIIFWSYTAPSGEPQWWAVAAHPSSSFSTCQLSHTR